MNVIFIVLIILVAIISLAFLFTFIYKRINSKNKKLTGNKNNPPNKQHNEENVILYPSFSEQINTKVNVNKSILEYDSFDNKNNQNQTQNQNKYQRQMSSTKPTSTPTSTPTESVKNKPLVNNYDNHDNILIKNESFVDNINHNHPNIKRNENKIQIVEVNEQNNFEDADSNYVQHTLIKNNEFIF